MSSVVAVAEAKPVAAHPEAVKAADGIAKPRGTPRQSFARHLIPWIVPIVGLAAWQTASLLSWLPPRLFPSPLDVGRAALRLAASGELIQHVAISTRRALLGFAIGGAAGLALGLINGLSRRTEQWLDTTVQMARAVPHLALVPLIILWLGIGACPRNK